MSSRQQATTDAYLEGQAVADELLSAKALRPKFFAATIPKSAGVTFAQNAGGRGAYIANLDEGSSQRLNSVCLGDWLVSVGDDDVTLASLDRVLELLEAAPLFVTLGLQRGGSEPWRAVDGLSADEMMAAVLAEYEGALSTAEQSELYKAFRAFKAEQDEGGGGEGKGGGEGNGGGEGSGQAEAPAEDEMQSSTARAFGKVEYELRSYISVLRACLSICRPHLSVSVSRLRSVALAHARARTRLIAPRPRAPPRALRPLRACG
jgi:hypothetical protein